jgi:macrocin-O-methyltransferase TylF-like protien
MVIAPAAARTGRIGLP